MKRWLPRRTAWYDLVLPKYVLRVQFIPFRGYCLRSLHNRTGYWGELLHVFPVPEFSVKRIELQKQAAGKGPSHLAAIESNVFGALSNLVAHCCITRYEDLSSRQPGWFTIKTRGAAWIVQVKDPDSCCSLQATANSLDDALALADLLLGTDEAPWEADAFLKQQKRK